MLADEFFFLSLCLFLSFWMRKIKILEKTLKIEGTGRIIEQSRIEEETNEFSLKEATTNIHIRLADNF